MLRLVLFNCLQRCYCLGPERSGFGLETILAQQFDVELRVIDLSYGIRLQSLAPVDQIEAFAVCLVAAASQHQQPCWEAPYDPANHRIAGLALLESLCHRGRLPVYGTNRERRPLKRESFNSPYQLC